MRSFDHMLVYHCAPTLAGLKPASLIRCCLHLFPDAPKRIDAYNCALNQTGLYIAILDENIDSLLLLVYRHHALDTYLRQPEHAHLLYQCGYAPQANMSRWLDTLRIRWQSDAIPHEIGLFLGYPLADVQGYQCHRGHNCLLCGYWKVYANPESAQQTFALYDLCRDALCQRVVAGESIVALCNIA